MGRHPAKNRIGTKKVKKVQKRKKFKTVVKKEALGRHPAKNRIGTKKVKKVQKRKKFKTVAAKMNAIELLIMLKRRPEIVTMENERCDNVTMAAYLKFLVIKGVERDFKTMRISPPCRAVDKVWHAHILNTAAYHCTCVHLFGQYVHHKPNVTTGMPEKMKAYWAAHAEHFPGEDEPGDGDGDAKDVLETESESDVITEQSFFGCG